MIYPLFFLMLALSLASYGFSERVHIALYPALTTFVLFTAYATKNPLHVMGKSTDGSFSWTICTLNLPWLLFTYVVWFIQRALSRESRVDRIINSVYIGSYPLHLKDEAYDLVIDLTAEFPKPKGVNFNYVCLPNLDGVPLADISIPAGITGDSKLLIHCAQGHGRSATYCSILLVRLGLAENIGSALALIQSERPGARPSSAQLGQLAKMD